VARGKAVNISQSSQCAVFTFFPTHFLTLVQSPTKYSRYSNFTAPGHFPGPENATNSTISATPISVIYTKHKPVCTNKCRH